MAQDESQELSSERPVAQAPPTGDARVDEAVAQLAGCRARPRRSMSPSWRRCTGGCGTSWTSWLRARARTDRSRVDRTAREARRRAGQAGPGQVTGEGRRTGRGRPGGGRGPAGGPAGHAGVPDAPITVTDPPEPDYVSRGGRKLAGALAAFAGSEGGGLAVAGRPAWTRGRPPGGSPTCCWGRRRARGRRHVGYGQLAWSLRTDPRVTVMDRVNVRTLEQVTPVPDLVVADLSFISLTLVLPALVACAAADADFVLLVKPQFEVGKGRVGSGGVVRETTDRSASIEKVAGAAAELGLGVRGVTAGPLPGRPGTWNISYGCAAARRRWTRNSCGGRSRRDPASGKAHDAGDGAHRAGQRDAQRPAGGRAADRCRDHGPHAGRRVSMPVPRRCRPAPRPPRAPSWSSSWAVTAACCGRRAVPPGQGPADRGEPGARGLPGRGRAGPD